MKACVLDFDGVLLRSMELHAEAYRRTLAPLGLAVEDRAVYRLEGATSEEIIATLLAEAGRDEPREVARDLANRKQVAYESLGPPRLYEGAEGLVRAVRAAADRLGLVTGTRRRNLERHLAPLLPLFDATLCAGEYTRGKPDPEPYRRAAERLGATPDRCAAVENAPRGVRSARAAGYGLVVGLTTTVPKADLVETGAHHVVGRHEEAARLVSTWLAESGSP